MQKQLQGFSSTFCPGVLTIIFWVEGAEGAEARANNIPKKLGRAKLVKVIKPLKKIDKI